MLSSFRVLEKKPLIGKEVKLTAYREIFHRPPRKSNILIEVRWVPKTNGGGENMKRSSKRENYIVSVCPHNNLVVGDTVKLFERKGN